MTGRAVDLAAAYAWQLHERGVHAATALAEALIPVRHGGVSGALAGGTRGGPGRHFRSRLRSPINAVSPSAPASVTRPKNIGLRIPLRPRRLKDYLVYEEHKKKSMARKGLEMPELWYRMPTYTNRNICGFADPGEDMHWPSYSKKLDFEFELAVVIGRQGRDIKAADALKYVAGITIYNDFSARDVQADEGRIGAGAGKSKDFDQGNVLGPCIVTLDEIDPADIAMILRVDGEEWARGHTGGMKFSWGQIIENASSARRSFRAMCLPRAPWIEVADLSLIDGSNRAPRSNWKRRVSVCCATRSWSRNSCPMNLGSVT